MKRRIKRNVERAISPPDKKVSKIPLNQPKIVEAVSAAVRESIAQAADEAMEDAAEEERVMAVASALIGYGIRLGRTTGATGEDLRELSAFHVYDSRDIDPLDFDEIVDDEPDPNAN